MFAKLKYVSTHASSQNCGARDPQPITTIDTITKSGMFTP
jgi:hypothetical protein